MTVAELIGKEIGVEVGESFYYKGERYMLSNGGVIRDYDVYSFNCSIVAEILTHKDKIVKINSLADSWDIKRSDNCYYGSANGKAGIGTGDTFIAVCNANKNAEYMKLIVDKQNLFRKMLKFADCNNCKSSDSFMYYIYFNIGKNKWMFADILNQYELSVIYFSSVEVVKKALEEFQNELEEIRLAEIKLRG